MDQEAIYQKARVALRSEKLPNLPPHHVGFARSRNLGAVCDLPVRRDETDLEIQVAARGGLSPWVSGYHVHVPCFAVWELILAQERV